MRFNYTVALLSGFLLISTFGAAQADNVQRGLDQQARNVQNEMMRGQITPQQAMNMDNHIYQSAQQLQVDKAMNGGHLNSWQQNQLGAQMMNNQAINNNVMARNAYGNGYNNSAYGYNNGGFSHHHNWAQPMNGGYGAPPPWTQGNQMNYQNMGNNWQNAQYGNYQQGGGIGNALRRLF